MILNNNNNNSTILFYQVIANIVKCSEVLPPEEIIALTRDHLGRSNPDDLFNGFIPVIIL